MEIPTSINRPDSLCSQGRDEKRVIVRVLLSGMDCFSNRLFEGRLTTQKLTRRFQLFLSSLTAKYGKV